jgi:hypothetical protein
MLDERRGPRIKPWRAAAAAVALLMAGAGGWFGRDWLAQHSMAFALAREASENLRIYGPDGFRPVEIKASDAGALLEATMLRGRLLARRVRWR